MRSVTILILAIAAGAAGAASRSVWDGVYSKEQAGRGHAAYNSLCARCHGEALLGGEDSPALVDKDFLEKWYGKSVGSLVELTHKTMPSDGPGKVSRQKCADIVAFLLSANSFPAGDSDLPTGADALDAIAIQAKK